MNDAYSRANFIAQDKIAIGDAVIEIHTIVQLLNPADTARFDCGHDASRCRDCDWAGFRRNFTRRQHATLASEIVPDSDCDRHSAGFQPSDDAVRARRGEVTVHFVLSRKYQSRRIIFLYIYIYIIPSTSNFQIEKFYVEDNV